jgi:hypothetical protein
MNRILSTRSYSIFFKKSPKIKLGRWSIQDDPETIDLKVDRANHDSCGGPLCTAVPLKTEKTKVVESEEEEMLRYYTVGSFHLYVKK